MKIKISYDGDLKCTVDKNGNSGSYEDGGDQISIPYYEYVTVKDLPGNGKSIQSIKIKSYKNSLLNPEYMWYLGVGYYRDDYGGSDADDWVHLLNLRPDNTSDYHDIAIFSSNYYYDSQQNPYNQYARSRPLINRDEQTCTFIKNQGADSDRQYIPKNQELILIVFAYPSENQYPSITSEGGSSSSGDSDLEIDPIEDDNRIDVGFSGSFEIEVDYIDNFDNTTLAEITKIFSSIVDDVDGIEFFYKFTKCKRNALYYYYTSENEKIPSNIYYEPQNQQTEKTWCKITSTPTDENNALTGKQTLTNLDPTKDYRVVVAGEIDDDDASEEGLLIEANNKIYCCITSEIVALPSHPSVSAGDPITKAQMDILRAYRNNTPPAVTQYNEITATTGNDYRANSASEGTNITAYWYNHS